MDNMTHKDYKIYSDVHLRHRMILEFCDRPWDTVDEMSEGIMDILVAQSKDNDVLYFAGDLMFQFGTYFDWLVKRLKDVKGEMRWVLGNHDTVFDKNGKIRDKVKPLTDMFSFVGYADQRTYHGKHVFISHYPLHIPSADTGRLVSLHGHNHGTVAGTMNRFDVGVDNMYGLRNHPDASDILGGYNFAPLHFRDAFELAQRELPAPYGDRDGVISF